MSNGSSSSELCAATGLNSSILLECCMVINSSNQAVHQPDEHEGSRQLPSALDTWLIGLLCVTVICVSSVLGLAIFPCIRRTTYELTIKFMVALAVGSLVATGCLFLMPEALGIASIADTDIRFAGYQYKCATICIGIYLFFLGEQLIKSLVLGRRAARESNTTQLRVRGLSGDLTHTAISDLPLKMVGYSPLDEHAERNGKLPQCNTEVSFVSLDETVKVSGKLTTVSNPTTSSQSSNGNYVQSAAQDGVNGETLKNVSSGTSLNDIVVESATKKKEKSPRKPVQPVAYMILLGDGLHNFIDGMAIGSAFTMSVVTGLSVSLAVLCEELPHELGDFAVMVNAGLPMRRAALYNFLCACSIFVGFAVGALLGDSFDGASAYIFSIAAGMFLYISLADMLPELVRGGHEHGAPLDDSHGDKPQHHTHEHGQSLAQKLNDRWLFAIQNVGIITGFTILFILSLYSGEMEKALLSLSNN